MEYINCDYNLILDQVLIDKEARSIFIHDKCNAMVTTENSTSDFHIVDTNELHLSGSTQSLNVMQEGNSSVCRTGNNDEFFIKDCENIVSFVNAMDSPIVYDNFTSTDQDHVLVDGNQLKILRIEPAMPTSKDTCSFPKYTLSLDGNNLECASDNSYMLRSVVNNENSTESKLNSSFKWYPIDENQETECIDLSGYSSNSDNPAYQHQESQAFVRDTPEFIHIEDITERDQGQINTVLGKNKSVGVLNEQNSQKDSEDDDVIFVKEYKLTEGLKKQTQEVNSEIPKRRNPRRKVQLEKASVDLVNKLAIPPSVFNARVRKSARKVTTSVKKCRRSNRLTGAISNPPSPLTKSDLRDWPDDGMHERPVYNENTNSIDKFDPFLKSEDSKLCASKNQVFSPSNKENQSPSVRKYPKKSRRKRNVSTGKRKEEKDTIDLSFLVHERLQLILGFISQLKEYERIKSRSTVLSGTTSQKKVFMESLELRNVDINASTTRENFAVEQPTSVRNPELYDLLADASILYSVVSGVEQVDLSKYLSSVNNNEASLFLETYFTNSNSLNS